METRKIEIEVPVGKTVKWVNGILTLVDEKDTRPVRERVKTFEDALRELGEEHDLIEQWNDFIAFFNNYISGSGNDIIAYMKLRIICAALNEGWEPKFDNNENRYYPWFRLYTDKEVDEMNDNEKKVISLISTDGYTTEYAGFGSSYAYKAPSVANAYFGSRLCLKSDELAVYCGRQFIDIWADFVLR